MEQARFVIDASVAFKLLVQEPDTDLVVRLVARASTIFAPDLMVLEIANALWRFARRPDVQSESKTGASGLPLHDERVRNAKGSLEALANGYMIEFVDSEKLAVRALNLALELDHPVYDCTYLALALEEEDTKLVTSDGKFRRKLASHPQYAGLVIDLAEADAL